LSNFRLLPEQSLLRAAGSGLTSEQLSGTNYGRFPMHFRAANG
jgi:hypothetical protein